MHFVIMGCGRVGASLARSLDRIGHDVAVVDQDADAFRRLDPDFGGSTVTGVGFDRDTLLTAGIERAFAVAAVSSGDNSNILTARVARETFGVEHVVARIYDPERAEVYERLGVPTVATVRWAADQVLRRLLPQGHLSEYTDPSGHVVIVQLAVSPAWIGRPLRDLEEASATRVAFLTRLGTAVVPHPTTAYQDGDLLHLSVERERVSEVERLLDQAPSQED